MKKPLNTACILLISAALVACAPAGTSLVQDSAVGGVGGAAIGAGTGAAIGSLISNGSVGQSALLGTAIGAPVGIAAGALYSTYSQNRQIAEGAEAIKANQQDLLARERELEEMRKDIVDDASAVKPSPSRVQPTYVGPRLGNRYR